VPITPRGDSTISQSTNPLTGEQRIAAENIRIFLGLHECGTWAAHGHVLDRRIFVQERFCARSLVMGADAG